MDELPEDFNRKTMEKEILHIQTREKERVEKEQKELLRNVRFAFFKTIQNMDITTKNEITFLLDNRLTVQSREKFIMEVADRFDPIYCKDNGIFRWRSEITDFSLVDVIKVEFLKEE